MGAETRLSKLWGETSSTPRTAGTMVPVEFIIDPEANCFEYKWWHKFIFWREWRYPRIIARTKRNSLEDFTKQYKEVEDEK